MAISPLLWIDLDVLLGFATNNSIRPFLWFHGTMFKFVNPSLSHYTIEKTADMLKTINDALINMSN